MYTITTVFPIVLYIFSRITHAQDGVIPLPDQDNKKIAPRVHKMDILEPIPIQNVIGRDTLILKCSASGNPVPKISWSLNGERFLQDDMNTEDGGVVIDEEKKNRRYTINGNTLTIRPINGKTDTGRYRCIATNDLGSVFLEKKINIRVMGYFKPGSRYDDPVMKLYPTVGKKFIMTCPPHELGYGTVYRWGLLPKTTNTPQYFVASIPYKTGFPMSAGRWGFSYVTNDNIKRSRDSGGFRCILFNYGNLVGSVSMMLWQPYEFRNERRKPILIQHMPEQMTAVANSEYTMLCGATGYPRPKYSWQYQGQNLKSRWLNGSTELNFEFFRILQGGHALKLRRITKYSGGTYRCYAENALGLTWKIGQLTVLFPPKFVTFLPDNFELPVGNSWGFNCTATGFPYPQYEWYHNGTRVKPSLKYTIAQGYLHIKEASFEDDGIWICLAINSLDTLTMSTYIETKAMPPVFDVPLNDPVYLFRTGRMYIDCKVKGGPRPTVTWFKDGTQINFEEERYTLLSNNALEIAKVVASDEGLYRCKADNIYGTAKSSGTAIVLEPTVITNPPYNLTYQVGFGYAELFCGASADPRLDLRIEFYKGGVKMAKFDGRVDIEARGSGPPRIIYLNDIRITDAGTYSCHAYTKVGDIISEDWAYGEFTVKGPPEPPAGVTVFGDCYGYNAQITWSRGEELGVETRRFYIEFATNNTAEENMWFKGNKPDEILFTEPGTITYYNLDRSNLPPGANLRFRVRGASDHAIGRPSRPSELGECITPPGVPIMNPLNVTDHVKKTGEFAIKWTPITDVHFGAPGFYYELGYKKVEDEEFTVVKIDNPTTHYYNLTDPGINQEYEFYVRSANSLGYGPEPEILKAFSGKEIPREAPRNVRVHLILRYSVDIKWTPVEGADGYRITYWNITDSESQRGHTPDYLKKRKRRSNHMGVLDHDSSHGHHVYRYQDFYGLEYRDSAPLENITADQIFMATVSALTNGGVGPESEIIEFTTSMRIPGPPHNVVFQIFGKSAKLSWHPPLEPNGYIEEYNIFWYKTDPDTRGAITPIQTMAFMRKQREAYLIDIFDPLEYYNIKLSARNRMGRGQEWIRLLVATSEEDIPGKPDAPSVFPFDDTSLNVTFRMSTYGGLPTSFRVLVRKKTEYYKHHIIYEQKFPQRAWILVEKLDFALYDFLCVGVNALGQSETSDVTEMRPIRRPKQQAHASIFAWWRSNWFILLCIILLFLILLVVSVFVILRKKPTVAYQSLQDEFDGDALFAEFQAKQQADTRKAALLLDELEPENDKIDYGNELRPYPVDSLQPPSYESQVNTFNNPTSVTVHKDSTPEKSDQKSEYSSASRSSYTSDSFSEYSGTESDYSSDGAASIKKRPSDEEYSDDASEEQRML